MRGREAAQRSLREVEGELPQPLLRLQKARKEKFQRRKTPSLKKRMKKFDGAQET